MRVQELSPEASTWNAEFDVSDAYIAEDGTNKAVGRDFTFNDGRCLFLGGSAPAARPTPRRSNEPPRQALVADPSIARGGPEADCRPFFDALSTFARVLAVKRYRMRLDPPPPVPVLPCLDHEAMLHEGIAPHAAAYIQDDSSDLHEVVYVPDDRRVDIDVVSTLGECSAESRQRLVTSLRSRFPGYTIRVVRPSRLRGAYRVADACRAQVALRDVLLAGDLDRVKAAVDRLQTISALMEKESRVASWGARTVMAPLIAVAGFLSYEVLGTFVPRVGSDAVAFLRYAIVGGVGAFFLYYGLKAVQLTEMANRVWKRSAEYGLILSERRRLGSP